MIVIPAKVIKRGVHDCCVMTRFHVEKRPRLETLSVNANINPPPLSSSPSLPGPLHHPLPPIIPPPLPLFTPH